MNPKTSPNEKNNMSSDRDDKKSTHIYIYELTYYVKESMLAERKMRATIVFHNLYKFSASCILSKKSYIWNVTVY